VDLGLPLEAQVPDEEVKEHQEEVEGGCADKGGDMQARGQVVGRKGHSAT
jgi:hypothetical protein